MNRTTRKACSLTAAIITFGSLVGGANAAITVDISGVPNSGEWTVTYNGSINLGFSLGASGVTLNNNSADGRINSLFGSGSGFDFFNNNPSMNSGGFGTTGVYVSGSSSVSGATVNFLGISVSNGSGVGDDVFRFTHGFNAGGSNGLGSHTYMNGDVINFTDYKVLFSSFDITQFNSENGNILMSQPGDSFSVTSTERGGITLNFTAVPEPSSALLLGLGSLGFVFRRSR